MNLRTNQKGFTIVELLIVVVVIAILAAISIVAYTGITNRANRSANMEAANSVRSVATTFQGTNGAFPLSDQQFIDGHNGDPTNAIAKLPCDIVFDSGTTAYTAAPASTKTVRVVAHRTAAGQPIAGLTIYYWGYGQPVDPIKIGDTSGTTLAALADTAC